MPAAIVTGSDSGIGRATVRVLAERGWDVGITFRSDDTGAKEIAEEARGLGVRAEVRHLELTDHERVPIVLQELAGALGGLDLLVNNAGMGIGSPFLDLDLDDWNQVLATNLTGTFVAAQTAARMMVARGGPGRIVNVTSVHEHVPLKDSSAYCASKGGLGLLTKCMALELAPHGITVNAVAPGEISTPMTGQDDEDPGEQGRKWNPTGRPGSAREIGEVIAFLASEGASYVTGASIVADGGLTLMAAIPNQVDP